MEMKCQQGDESETAEGVEMGKQGQGDFRTSGSSVRLFISDSKLEKQ